MSTAPRFLHEVVGELAVEVLPGDGATAARVDLVDAAGHVVSTRAGVAALDPKRALADLDVFRDRLLHARTEIGEILERRRQEGVATLVPTWMGWTPELERWVRVAQAAPLCLAPFLCAAIALLAPALIREPLAGFWATLLPLSLILASQGRALDPGRAELDLDDPADPHVLVPLLRASRRAAKHLARRLRWGFYLSASAVGVASLGVLATTLAGESPPLLLRALSVAAALAWPVYYMAYEAAVHLIGPAPRHLVQTVRTDRGTQPLRTARAALCVVQAEENVYATPAIALENARGEAVEYLVPRTPARWAGSFRALADDARLRLHASSEASRAGREVEGVERELRRLNQLLGSAPAPPRPAL